MNTPLTPAPLDATVGDPVELDVDWLVVPVFEGEDGRELAAVSPTLAREVSRMLAPGDYGGKRFELLATTPEPPARARRLVLMGGGAVAQYSTEIARRLAAAAVILATERGVRRLAFVHRQPAGEQPSTAAWVQAASEGLTLGEFDPARYKTSAEGRRSASPALTVAIPGTGVELSATAAKAASRGRLLAHCANLARELVNEPGNLLPPRVLADRAREIAAGTSLTVDVLDEQQIAALGMGLLLGVGQGSHEPPRLIVLSHAPAGAPEQPVLALVGKGVTFDTGGISIKSAEGMERMKDDMAGGAAVLLAIRAIALLNVPLRVVAVVPAVENMPGGGAIRPGDVLRGASGRTVEVVNTDAEGRLALGDAVWYAQRLGATHVVDVATLTGACMVALGKSATGVFGRPDSWRARVEAAANACGERTWPMPVFDDYVDLLKSEIADTSNTGGRYGGAITAAIFIGEFARNVAWTHLDVAGTAWNDESKPYLPKGPTGVGVRTLAELADAMSRES